MSSIKPTPAREPFTWLVSPATESDARLLRAAPRMYCALERLVNLETMTGLEIGSWLEEVRQIIAEVDAYS